MKKINELKKSNKSIEEIYKYTRDIILEEEDEEEDEDGRKFLLGSEQRSRSVAPIGGPNLKKRKNT